MEAAGTYFVKGSLAAPLAAGPWAPSKVPPREVVRPLDGAVVERPALGVHAVGQERWELSSTTSWGVATVRLATDDTATTHAAT